ncbi:hypothetical protein [Acidaminococcus fermentans]|nr:hypothetical protein [Acidaminococcus fermentans]
MKIAAVFLGIVGMAIAIKWDKEAVKAFITGGIFGAWMFYIYLKKRK